MFHHIKTKHRTRCLIHQILSGVAAEDKCFFESPVSSHDVGTDQRSSRLWCLEKHDGAADDGEMKIESLVHGEKMSIFEQLQQRAASLRKGRDNMIKLHFYLNVTQKYL